MQNSEKARDRAYVRHILIKRVDYERFLAHLSTIQREKFITKCRPQGEDYMWIHAKLKKDEILFMKLSFDITVVMKPNQKKSVVSTSAMWKPC